MFIKQISSFITIQTKLISLLVTPKIFLINIIDNEIFFG